MAELVLVLELGEITVDDRLDNELEACTFDEALVADALEYVELETGTLDDVELGLGLGLETGKVDDVLEAGTLENVELEAGTLDDVELETRAVDEVELETGVVDGVLKADTVEDVELETGVVDDVLKADTLEEVELETAVVDDVGVELAADVGLVLEDEVVAPFDAEEVLGKEDVLDDTLEVGPFETEDELEVVPLEIEDVLEVDPLEAGVLEVVPLEAEDVLDGVLAVWPLEELVGGEVVLDVEMAAPDDVELAEEVRPVLEVEMAAPDDVEPADDVGVVLEDDVTTVLEAVEEVEAELDCAKVRFATAARRRTATAIFMIARGIFG